MATEHTTGGKKETRKSRTAIAHPDDRPTRDSTEHMTHSPAREARPISPVNEGSGVAARAAASQDGSQSAFDSLYLQQMTREFATDLDKLRTASDFRSNSLPLLIEALKQGTACFSDRERQRVALGLRKE